MAFCNQLPSLWQGIRISPHGTIKQPVCDSCKELQGRKEMNKEQMIVELYELAMAHRDRIKYGDILKELRRFRSSARRKR